LLPPRGRLASPTTLADQIARRSDALTETARPLARTARKSADYLASLNDGRSVYADGERIINVAEHPGLAGGAQTIGRLFDLTAGDPTLRTPGGAIRAISLPTTTDELHAWWAAVRRWALVSQGFLGRSPDHVGMLLAGMASRPDLFNRGGRNLGQGLVAFYNRMLAEDLYLSYCIVPPQLARTAGDRTDDYPQVGGVSADEEGIVVRGGQSLATGGALADFLFVSCVRPLGPGEERFAVSFVVPLAAPGLRLIARRLYAASATGVYDYPLTSRFDEGDVFVVFDDVRIPWEHVFAYRDPTVVAQQFFATPGHVLSNAQAQTRFVVKLKFLLGLARKLTASNGIEKLPPIQEKLGELASIVAMAEGMNAASIHEATIEDGVAIPRRRYVYGAVGMQPEIYPRVIQILRDLSGAGVLQLPASSRDLETEDIAGDVVRFMRPSAEPREDRVKLFRAVWDVIGSEYGGRHQQYEMFYAGASFVVRGYSFRNYGFDEPLAQADDFFAGYGLGEGD
jgi:4-hydroxyphenylacetate 3-monooxygenase